MNAKYSINSCDGLGLVNSVCTATKHSFYVPELASLLSIKAVLSGRVVLTIDGRKLMAREGSFVVVNDRQRFALTIESRELTTMFCIFFARGFVEDIWRSTVTPTSELLDDSTPDPRQTRFFDRIETQTESVLPSLRPFQRLISSGQLTPARWDETFLRLGTELVQAQEEVLRRARKIPAAKSSTRLELCRRLLRGRDFLLSSWDHRLKLNDVARQACLSPYHFHRAFTRFFGKTPHHFLSDYRLERAAAQLRRTERSVTELSSDCGFESLPSFSNLFQRRYGISPREYRRTWARNSKIRKIG